jgi:hypothetical protein
VIFRSHLWPGGGFVALVGAVAIGVSFFAWGIRDAPLEEVWRIQTELELGTRGPLSDRELRLFQDVLQRHAELAESLLAGEPHGVISASSSGRVEIGYAYLVRHRADLRIALRVKPTGISAQADPAQVRVRVLHQGASGTASAEAPFEWVPPGDGPFPQLIEVRVSGQPPPPMTVELGDAR